MSPNCPVCGAFIAHLRDTHSCPGPSGRVSVVDPRDAHIAALAEKLRRSELDKDEMRRTMTAMDLYQDTLAEAKREHFRPPRRVGAQGCGAKTSI